MTPREFMRTKEYKSLNAHVERAVQDMHDAATECERLCPAPDGLRWAVSFDGALMLTPVVARFE